MCSTLSIDQLHNRRVHIAVELSVEDLLQSRGDLGRVGGQELVCDAVDLQVVRVQVGDGRLGGNGQI